MVGRNQTHGEKQMSKMKDIEIDVEDLILNGYELDDIALMLDIPYDWVTTIAKKVEEDVS